MATALALAAHIHVICISTVHIIFISCFIPFELSTLVYSQNMGLHTVPQLVEYCRAKKEQGLNLIKALKNFFGLICNCLNYNHVTMMVTY